MIVSALLHPGQVLDGARDAEREVDLRLDGLARLADLARVRHPAGVDERPRHAERRADRLGQLLELRRRRPCPRSRGRSRAGTSALRDVHVAGLGLAEAEVLGARPRRRASTLDRADGASPRRPRLERAGAQHQQRRLRAGEVELGRPACRRSAPRLATGPSVPAERGHVAREAEPERVPPRRARTRASRSCGRAARAPGCSCSISASSARSRDVGLEVLAARRATVSTSSTPASAERARRAPRRRPPTTATSTRPPAGP